MENKKITHREIALITGAAILAGIGIYFAIQAPKKKAGIKFINDVLDAKIKDPNSSVGQNIISSDALNKLPSGNFPLKFGDANQKVYATQQAVNKRFGTSVDLDGKYGDALFQAMCSNLWNTKLTTYKYIDCYNTTLSGVVRRPIAQSDYDAIK